MAVWRPRVIHKLRLQGGIGKSTVCRFSYVAVKEFVHKCQHVVGRGSIMEKILLTSFLNTPLSFNIDATNAHCSCAVYYTK